MIVESQFRRWRWKFSQDHVYLLPFSISTEKPLIIQSSSGTTLVELQGDKCRINRHYHFDGATWAIDFESVLSSAALHDALLQLKDKYPTVITESMAHNAFKNQMRQDRFKLRLLYGFFTRPFFRNIYKFLNQNYEK